MRKVCFALFFAVAGTAAAQQVQLLETDSKSGSPAVSAGDGMVPVIAPSEEKTSSQTVAAELVVSTPAAKKAVPAKNAAPKSSEVKTQTAPTAAPVPAKSAVVSAAPAAPAKTAAAQPSEKAPVVPAAAPAPAKPAAPKKAAAAPKPAVKPAPASPAAGAGFSVGKRHTVLGGDTLWDLSGKYYKDPFKWGKIYNANLDTVSNPDRIYPKEELLIPDLTEEVRPANTAIEIAGSETIADPALTSADLPRPAAAPAAAPATDTGTWADEFVQGYTPSDLSEEMPVDQKEWGHGVKIVPDSWTEDGVVSGKVKIGQDDLEDGQSMTGEIFVVKMSPKIKVKAGDYLAVYMKGSEAFDKSGHRLGRELQAAGLAEVITVEGQSVKARLLDAVTPVLQGYVVKKR